jgi:hypothetical protein
MSIGTKIAIYAIGFSGIVTGVFYIKALQSEIEAGKIRESKYTETIAAKDAVAEQLKSDLERMNRAQNELNAKLAQAQVSVNDLQKKFTQSANGKPRDLNSLAIRSPNIMQDKINKGTIDALRCNELITGSPLTEEEKSGKVINKICPDLLPKVEQTK